MILIEFIYEINDLNGNVYFLLLLISLIITKLGRIVLSFYRDMRMFNTIDRTKDIEIEIKDKTGKEIKVTKFKKGKFTSSLFDLKRIQENEKSNSSLTKKKDRTDN